MIREDTLKKYGNNIGSIIRNKRKEMSLSLEQLAKETEISESRLFRIETQRCDVSVEVLKKLTQALNLDPSKEVLVEMLTWEILERKNFLQTLGVNKDFFINQMTSSDLSDKKRTLISMTLEELEEKEGAKKVLDRLRELLPKNLMGFRINLHKIQHNDYVYYYYYACKAITIHGKRKTLAIYLGERWNRSMFMEKIISYLNQHPKIKENLLSKISSPIIEDFLDEVLNRF